MKASKFVADIPQVIYIAAFDYGKGKRKQRYFSANVKPESFAKHNETVTIHRYTLTYNVEVSSVVTVESAALSESQQVHQLRKSYPVE